MEWVQLLVGGGLFGLLGGVLVFVATRKRDTATDSQERFSANLELNKYIDEKVAAALAPALKQIADLDAAVATLTAREQTTKATLRRYFQRLLWWDQRGRPNEMPMPSAEDMAILDLTDIEEDTMSAAQVAAIKAQPEP
jgi:hypothetical protein